MGQERNHAQARDADPPLDHFDARSEQGQVAAKLVDGEAADARAVFGVEQCQRAGERSEHAAAIDIAHQQALGIGRMGHAHVDDVVLAQIDFRWRAGAFEQHQIVGLGQFPVAFEHLGEEVFDAAPMIVECADLSPDAAQHHDLRGGVAAGLDEHRVHFGRRNGAAGFRLQGLGAADLAAVGRGGGIERHVLGLEGGDAPAGVGEDSAQTGGHQRLAHVRGGSQHHQGARAHSAVPVSVYMAF